MQPTETVAKATTQCTTDLAEVLIPPPSKMLQAHHRQQVLMMKCWKRRKKKPESVHVGNLQQGLGNLLHGPIVAERGHSSDSDILTTNRTLAAAAVSALELEQIANIGEGDDSDIIIESSSLLKSTKQPSLGAKIQ